MIITSIAIVITIIFITGLFVAAEFAVVSSRRTKVFQLASQNDPLAKLLLPVLEDPRQLNRYVTACQIGITVGSLVLGAYARMALVDGLTVSLAQLSGGSLTPASVENLAHVVSVVIVLAFIVALQVVLGEHLPKSLSVQYPEAIARGAAWPMRIAMWIMAFPIWLINGSASVILRLIGRKGGDYQGRAHSPEEIEILVTSSHEGGLLDDNERRLLRNALRMRDLTARQVMVHRTRIAAAPIDVKPLELMQMAIDAGYSRFPIFRDSIDDIVGFVHVKDVFRLHNEGITEVSSVIRDVVYVPETLSINDVWDQLDIQNRYLAIVFDEFGGTAGLLTLEDLIEEIFGELQDEFDDEAAVIARDKEGRIYLRGDLLISDVNEYLELDLPEETADTLSGLIFSLLGRPPVVGDEARIGDVAFRVEVMEDLGVGELSLLLPPTDIEPHFTEWDIADHE